MIDMFLLVPHIYSVLKLCSDRTQFSDFLLKQPFPKPLPVLTPAPTQGSRIRLWRSNVKATNWTQCRFTEPITAEKSRRKFKTQFNQSGLEQKQPHQIQLLFTHWKSQPGVKVNLCPATLNLNSTFTHNASWGPHRSHSETASSLFLFFSPFFHYQKDNKRTAESMTVSHHIVQRKPREHEAQCAVCGLACGVMMLGGAFGDPGGEWERRLSSDRSCSQLPPEPALALFLHPFFFISLRLFHGHPR